MALSLFVDIMTKVKTCPKCRSVETEKISGSWGPHRAKLQCSKCKAFICWAKQTYEPVSDNLCKPEPFDVTYVVSLTGTILTEEQLNIAEALAKGTKEKQIQTLGGLAGTGKSTIVSHLFKRLPKYACCAYTGKAADVLRAKGVDATTIHSLIYNTEKDHHGQFHFFKKDNIPCRGVIVDEASMVGREIYDDLLSFDVPIIFVGDHGQLEPVREDIYLMREPDYKLETVHRNAGDIALFAQELRMGKSALDFPKSKVVNVIAKKDCHEYALDADQIICAKNDTRVSMNRWIRNLKGFNGDQPCVNDRVISLMNSRKYGIFNGTQGVISHINYKTLTMRLDNGSCIKVPYSNESFNVEKSDGTLNFRFHPFDYAYAITCHKAQGSEWGKVVVLEQVVGLWDHRRWAYTAASRAKSTLTWISA